MKTIEELYRKADNIQCHFNEVMRIFREQIAELKAEKRDGSGLRTCNNCEGFWKCGHRYNCDSTCHSSHQKLNHIDACMNPPCDFIKTCHKEPDGKCHSSFYPTGNILSVEAQEPEHKNDLEIGGDVTFNHIPHSHLKETEHFKGEKCELPLWHMNGNAKNESMKDYYFEYTEEFRPQLELGWNVFDNAIAWGTSEKAVWILRAVLKVEIGKEYWWDAWTNNSVHYEPPKVKAVGINSKYVQIKLANGDYRWVESDHLSPLPEPEPWKSEIRKPSYCTSCGKIILIEEIVDNTVRSGLRHWHQLSDQREPQPADWERKVGDETWTAVRLKDGKIRRLRNRNGIWFGSDIYSSETGEALCAALGLPIRPMEPK